VNNNSQNGIWFESATPGYCEDVYFDNDNHTYNINTDAGVIAYVIAYTITIIGLSSFSRVLSS